MEREQSNEVTEDQILPVIDQTDLGYDLAIYYVTSGIRGSLQFSRRSQTDPLSSLDMYMEVIIIVIPQIVIRTF